MHFEPSQIYLVYNHGNDRQQIFFNEDNYLFFLRKIRAEWLPLVDILAYTLMPNHFKFLVVPGKVACHNITIKERETHLQVFSKVIGKTLSSYARAINIEQFRSGNLFQKKTKATLISPNKLSGDSFPDFLQTCVREIHQVPVSEGLAPTPEDWPFSSAMDHLDLRDDTLCNKNLLASLSQMMENDFSSTNTSATWKQPVMLPTEPSGHYSGLTGMTQ